ncbi:DNRLRE domain-containing protein, partial [Adlercreutzia sp. R25]
MDESDEESDSQSLGAENEEESPAAQDAAASETSHDGEAPDPYEILNAPVDYYDEVEPEGELVSTDEGVTVYRLSERTFKTVIGGAATAYVDESGSPQCIDNTLVPASDESRVEASPAEAASGAEPSSPEVAVLLIEEDGTVSDESVDASTVYQPKANHCEVAIPAVMEDEGILISKNGHDIRLVPENGMFDGSVAEGNAIRFTDVFPGVDYQYTLVGSLIKEDIVLTRPVEPFRLATRIEVDESATVSLEGGVVVVRERAEGPEPGRELVSIAAPIAIDAAEALDNSLSLSLEKAQDGTAVAVLNANWEWLTADERAYPIRIDPTIDIATTAMRLTSVEQLAPNIWVGENNYQYAGYDDGDATGTGDYRGGEGLGMTRVYLDINYDFGNIMDEALIKSADLKLHQRTRYSKGATVFGLYRNKGNWDFNEITWNSQKSMGHEFITSQNARSTKGYLTWDVREPVNNWVQGIWKQQGLCVKATDERWMQCELFDHRYSDNPPSLEITWEVPDPVSESVSLNATTINLRTVTETDFSGKLQFDGVFADGVAKPRSMVAYELVGKSDAGVAYASRSYKYPDSSEWEKSAPNGTKYRDKLSNWQSKLFSGLAYNTSYKIRARAAANGSSGKLVETDSFLIYRATAKDTLPSIAAHYGVTLNTLARDNRVQDTLVVGGNTIFVRNPKTTKAYNPKQLTDTQKKRIDSALMGRGKHCEYGFEPINLNTGNFILEAADATVPDYRGDFSISRTYNAQGEGYQSAFGRNWSFAWEESLGLQANGAVVYSAGDGKTFWFDADGKGGFKAHAEEHLTLKKIAYKSGSATRYRWEITDSQGAVRRFDCYGRLTEVADDSGAVTKISRDSAGRITAITAPSGTRFSVTCNSQGLITAIGLPGGSKLGYSYDNAGNLTGFTDAAGRKTRYEYDSAGRMTAWYDANGHRVVANTYDGAGRVVKQIDLAGRASTLAYGSGLTRATDAAGRTTVHRYDSRGRTTAIEYPDGSKAVRTYGANNTLASDEDGTYTYDALGNMTSATSPDGHVTRMTWDAKSRMTSQTDPDGATTRWAYDGRGNVISEASPSTGKTTYTYDSLNRRTSATDADGVRESYTWSGANLTSVSTAAGVTRFAYDAMGRKVSETGPDGACRTWVYDVAGRLVGEQDAEGGYTTYRLDAMGFLLSTSDAAGNTTSFSYDGAYNITAMTDPAGGVTRYGYDAAGNLVSQTDPNGAVAKYVYDKRDRRIAKTDALGHTTRYAFDERGNVVRVESPGGGVEVATYDDTYGVPLAYKDALGNTTIYEYSASGLLTAVTHPDGAREETTWAPGGLQSSHTDALGVATCYTYSAAGRATGVEQAGRAWTFAYDAAGNMASATNPARHRYLFRWDKAGNFIELAGEEGVVASWTYDKAGRITSESDASGATNGTVYDELGNVVSQTDARGSTTTYAYDAFGAVTKQTDALGQEVRCEYDAAGNPVVVTDALGNRRTAAYDLMGNLVKATDALGNAATYEYDAVGRMTARTRPDGAHETYEYDLAGNLVRLTDVAGRVTENTYDARGNLISTTDASGRTETFEYDAAGKVTGATDALGRKASISYDSWGQVVSETDYDGATTTYEYDLAGNPIRVTDALGAAQSYAWDARGNLVSETREADGASTSYTYDAVGNLTAALDALEQVQRWSYDAAGNLTEAVDEEGNATSFVYDALGRLVSSADALGNATALEWDANGNLVAATSPRGARDEWTYDGEGNVVAHIDPLGNAEAWEWDAVGNLVAHRNFADGVTRYTYDPLGQMLTETDPLDRTTAYEFDNRGNVVSRVSPSGARWDYRWDALDRLTGITTPRGYEREIAYDEAGNAVLDRDNLGARTEYTYDALHRMTARADVAGRTSTWEYDALGNLVAETDSAGLRTEYAYDALDRLVAQKDSLGRTASWSWDARGNLAAQGGTAQEGLVYQWDAAGNLVGQTDARGNETGYQWDADGNLVELTTPSGAKTTYTWDLAGNLTAAVDSLKRVSSWTYDALGRVVGATDRNGGETTYEWDGASQLTKVVSPTGAETRYGWDVDGNLAQITDAMGRVTEYAYDAEGALVSVTSPSGALEQLVRDPAGQVTASIDAAGNETRYDWDELGNLVEKGYAADETAAVLYAYDANGLVTERTDDTGEATTERDELGRVTAETDGAGRRIEYTYDEYGQLATVAYPNGSQVEYGYDEAGNLTEVNAPEGDYIYAYDEENRPVSLERPDGSSTTYAYDGEGQLLRLENLDAEGASISWFAYEWDGEGNPVSEESLAAIAGGGQSHTVRTYAYDGDGRLVALEEETSGSSDAYFCETYEWDAAGNRTAVERVDRDSGERARTELVYDDDDRLVESVGPDGRTTYEYDDAGNLVQKTTAGEDPVLYAYTVENRLEAVRQGGRVLMAATYDGDGNRVFQASLYRTNEMAEGERSFSWLEGKQVELSAAAPELEETVWTSPTRVAPRWTPDELTGRLESGVMKPVRAEAPKAGWGSRRLASTNGQPSAAPLKWALYGGVLGACSALAVGCPPIGALAAWLDGLLDPTSPVGAAPLGFPMPKYAGALASTGLSSYEQRRVLALSGPGLPLPSAVGLRAPLVQPKPPEEEPPTLQLFGLRYGTIPTYSPYVQERWELVEYVNSTVLDDVAQPVWRESSAVGELADVYGLSRLSTSGGSEGLAVSDSYLEDGLGSVSAVLREGGAVAASYSYSPWGDETCATESLPGYGGRFELPHYGYNAEQSSPEGGLQYLRARWYDASMGAFGSRDSYLGDAADPASLNRYAYAGGNPVAYADPTGHDSRVKYGGANAERTRKLAS